MNSFGERVKRFVQHLAEDPSQPNPPTPHDSTDATTPFAARPAAADETGDTADAPLSLDEAIAQLLERQHDVAVRVDRIADHIEKQTSRVDELTSALDASQQATHDTTGLNEHVERLAKVVDELPRTSAALGSRLDQQEKDLTTIREECQSLRRELRATGELCERVMTTVRDASERDAAALDSLNQSLGGAERRLAEAIGEAAKPARHTMTVAIISLVISLATLAGVGYLLVRHLQ